ncbi:MAG TPA: putative sulfate exporter family transporter [Fimbriimonadaceae bacterium]|nr:putative sulfate exporter family transporter [Fimbriimonadaceae bacterium]
MSRDAIGKAIFFLAAVFCLTPWSSPPIALILGAALALSLGNPFPNESKKYSKILLQVAVVFLGFAMDLHKVLDAGEKGIAFALISIGCVFLLGWGLQKLLGVRPITSLLVSTGTAICGGSAIAAMSTVADAPQEDVSVSVGTVFLLNAVALLIFPPLGHALKLTGDQFGTWAGIAIHDVSSVVGAATAYGGGALANATAVKLSRVLYLIPITLLASYLLNRTRKGEPHEEKGKAKAQIPWFIGLFLLASLAQTYIPAIQAQATPIKTIASAGFSLSLFLIGSGLTMKTLKQVGFRPLLQGIGLWLFISVVSLAVVKGLL